MHTDRDTWYQTERQAERAANAAAEQPATAWSVYQQLMQKPTWTEEDVQLFETVREQIRHS